MTESAGTADDHGAGYIRWTQGARASVTDGTWREQHVPRVVQSGRTGSEDLSQRYDVI